jgi:hypothetical protein
MAKQMLRLIISVYINFGDYKFLSYIYKCIYVYINYLVISLFM